MSKRNLNQQGVTNDDKHITYVPPAAKIVDQFAQNVCQQLAANGYSSCNEPEVIRGLAAFLNVIADIMARHCNEGKHEFLDRPHEER